MRLVESVRTMQEWADRERAQGRRIGFVPTMGYLHEGHLSLVRLARERADSVVVSIFVNPLQFGANEDFDRYPRDPVGDRRKLEAAGVDVLFFPEASELYPPGFQTTVEVSEVTRGLCGISRPTHFRGVTTVVAKLFLAVKPHVAVFGAKDFQQLVTVKQMVRDLNFDVEIIAGPIVREADGLAMSSRNAYLTPEERQAARVIPESLAEARRAFAAGESSAERLREIVIRRLSAEPRARVDYVEVVDAETLQPVTAIERAALLAIAAFFGRTRLIDNCVLAPSDRALEHNTQECFTEGNV
ncbi:MAG: pantoate--beta-alanine ligase [Candidatus Binatia bacterium]|nr:pantoate--beta-alanine ligase [Candidatus Binatia bacterium]